MLPFLVPVDSHTALRAPVLPPEPGPDAGAVWGRASTFEILNPAEDPGASSGADDGESADAEEARRGGLTITWPQERIDTVQSRDMTPVWRSYDVVEVPSEDDPAVTIQIAVTRQLLFPLGTETLRYVSDGSYVVDTAGRPFQERVVHSYLLLDMPPLHTDKKVVEYGLTDGVWPRYREELFTPGRFG